MYVMIKYLEQQRANKKDPDPRWLRTSRRTAFFFGSLLMTLSGAAAWRTGEISPYIVLMLLISIIMILSFNALSQHIRTPPEDRRDDGVEDLWRDVKPAGSFGYYLAQDDIERLSVEISRLVRGNRLTHLQLEALFNHLKIKPEPVVIPADPVIIHPAQFRPR
jgi:hypothetical protein